MKRTVAILLVLMIGLLTACAVPPKTEVSVTDPEAGEIAVVRQTEADTKADLAQSLTEQQEVEAAVNDAVKVDTLDHLEQYATELLEKYEAAKASAEIEEAARKRNAWKLVDEYAAEYESVLAEINAMLG